MAFTTYEDRLTKIRNAIDDLIEGRVASVQIGDKQYNLQNLKMLEAMEQRLEIRIAKQATGGRMLVVPRRAGGV